MILYAIKNTVNDKIYIGLTVRSLKVRWLQHLSKFKNIASYRHKNIPLYRAMSKHGVDKFYIEKIYTASSLEDLYNKEKEFISKYHSTAPHGYNGNLGGFGGRLSEEVLIRMAATRRGQPCLNKEQLRKHWLGRKKTAEHARNISLGKQKAIVDENGNNYSSVKDAGQKLGIHPQNISKVLHKLRKSAGGHIFYFKEKL